MMKIIKDVSLDYMSTRKIIMNEWELIKNKENAHDYFKNNELLFLFGGMVKNRNEKRTKIQSFFMKKIGICEDEIMSIEKELVAQKSVDEDEYCSRDRTRTINECVKREINNKPILDKVKIIRSKNRRKIMSIGTKEIFIVSNLKKNKNTKNNLLSNLKIDDTSNEF